MIGGECCENQNHTGTGLPKVLIVGSPNVGKSVLFNRLTGRYVTVSNYPGTTVEVSRGRSKVLEGRFEVVDTPGMYSLSAITDEERVACRLLLNEPAQAVLHVIDAKNIERMLGVTLQLIEAGLPVILVLNMADEVRRLGIRIDTRRLGELLHIPVVETVATTGEGIGELAVEIGEVQPAAGQKVDYSGELEQAITEVAEQLDEAGGISRRTRALLLLQEDSSDIEKLIGTQDAIRTEAVRAVVSAGRGRLEHSPHYYATLATKREADRILSRALSLPAPGMPNFREKLSRLCMHPLTGIPLLLLVLYFGLYKFVGEFGAGTVVGFLEDTVFGKGINPWVNRAAEAVIPWQTLRELFAGQYGIITLGVRYAVAIILPIVGTFFVAFSILEDSGYLPRLAMLIDRVFKKIGLNGRAVIPIVLGFGCDTMATMVTRTLETRRERVIASFLLALAIPCSAQLGVILGLLAGHPYALLVWAGAVATIFLLAGLLAARLLPGRGPSFYMELPPLRLPKLTNVAVKTYTRIVWYFREVLPLFILASVFIWVGRVTGIFDLLVRGLEPVVNLIGLPDGAAVAFLFGFFRRDYGAAGLYDLQKAGALSGVQLAVAAITLTLFLPCIAQFLMMKKERGWKLTLLTSTGILVLAFVVGFVANAILNGLGAQL
ncbi:MAG: ferrous iron transport protein B [Actinobacteria bacterium]|nr:ferrous iron transport protein B [Actinomycetota bacterium]